MEREQRWLRLRLPAGVAHPAAVVDRYVGGTQLRLRRVESDTGVAFKLGQKVRVAPSDPEVVKLTNLLREVTTTSPT